MIFMGNGPASMAQCEALHARLESGFSTLSGMQQGGARRGTLAFTLCQDKLASIVRETARAFGFVIEEMREETEEEYLGKPKKSSKKKARRKRTR